MMKTITVYTPQELKEDFPDGYDKAYQNYRDSVEWIPWMDEIIQSLKEVFSYSGIKLTNWEIGAWCYSHVSFDLDEDIGNLSGARALGWLENNLLSYLRIPWYGEKRNKVRKYGSEYHAGKIKPCPFTGFFADEDFINSLKEDLKDGGCIQDAYSNLADVAKELIEAENEYVMSEEYFLESEHLEYTQEGRKI